MLIYLLLFPVIGLFYVLFLNKQLASRGLFLGLSFGFLALVAAVRAPSVGTDVKTYQSLFLNTITGDVSILTEKSEVYSLYNQILGYISHSPQIITAANSIIICVLTALFIYRIGVHELFATYLFISMYFYANSLNTARQYVAVAIVLNALVFLLQKRYLPYFILILLAVGVHTSAIVGLTFLPISLIKWNRVWAIIFTFTMIIVGFLYNLLLTIFVSLFPVYQSYLSDTANQGVGAGTTGKGAVLFYDLFLLLVFVGLFWAIRKWEIKLTDTEATLLALYSVSVVLGLIFYKVILFQRIMMFFSIIGIVAIPILCDKITAIFFQGKYARIWISIGIFAVTFAVYVIQLQKGYGGVTPYQTFDNITGLTFIFTR